MNNPYPPSYYIGKWVKIRYSKEDEEELTLWMKVQNVYDGKLIGTLANNPVYPTGKGFGSQYGIGLDAILGVKR